MKGVTKRLLSIGLTICMVMVMVLNFAEPVAANPAPPTGNVQQRIQQLQILFPNGSFFSASGGACSGNHGWCGSYNDGNCGFRATMRRLGYTSPNPNTLPWSYTCAAFARFAWFYVFGHPLEWF